METIIISRHAGAIEWLAQRGITGPVITGNATPDDVRGKVVVGALPLHLAALAVKIGSIDMPGLRADQRGKDLTPAEMDAAGACIRWYVVTAC
jgi:CRISPR-associated protein Csx16